MGRAGSKYFTLCSPPECLINNWKFCHQQNHSINLISKSQLQTIAVKNSFSRLQMKILNLKNLALVRRAMGN